MFKGEVMFLMVIENMGIMKIYVNINYLLRV